MLSKCEKSIFIFLGLLTIVSGASPVYLTNCTESVTRDCVYLTNITAFLSNIKRGGATVTSTGTYDSAFFPCVQYNYNCGYMQEQIDYLTIANGVQLDLTLSQFSTIVSGDATIVGIVQPFLGRVGESAACLTKYFSLVLSDTQSLQVLNGYLNRQNTNLSAIYNSKKAVSSFVWSNLNINIITATLQMAKYYGNSNILSSNFWSYLLSNQFSAMSSQLKNIYANTSCLQCLHSSYLIDSVSNLVSRTQSINFLVDQSSTLGIANFNLIKSFLTSYVTNTNDDSRLTSVNFYDSAFEGTVGFQNTKTNIISQINAKNYRANSNPNLGVAINQTITKIQAASFSSGIPKIIVVIVGSSSVDSVLLSAKYAQAVGMSLIVIALPGSNPAQVQQLVNQQTNIINVASYSSLPSLSSYIGNYFSKQIVELKPSSTLVNNNAKTVKNPCYFRVPRNPSTGIFGKITIKYYSDPQPRNQAVYQSHYDPFPDNYSKYKNMQTYRTSITTRTIFISPVSSQNLPLKKNITVTQSPQYSYISVGGDDLSFDIDFTYCTTSNCTQQRTHDKSIGSLNADTFLSKQPESSNVLTPTVFAGITGSLLLLGGATYLTIKKLQSLVNQLDNLQQINQTGQNMHLNNQNNIQNQPQDQIEFQTQEKQSSLLKKQNNQQKKQHKKKQKKSNQSCSNSNSSDNKSEKQSKNSKNQKKKNQRKNSCENKKQKNKNSPRNNQSNQKKNIKKQSQNQNKQLKEKRPKSSHQNKPKSPKNQNRPKSPKHQNKPKSPKHQNKSKSPENLKNKPQDSKARKITEQLDN